MPAVAVPAVKETSTVTVPALAGESVTTKARPVRPESPSTTDASAMESSGAPSSSRMVPVTEGVASSAFALGVVRRSARVSFDSSSLSEAVLTTTCFEVSSGRNVSVVNATAV